VIYFQAGSETAALSAEELREGLFEALGKLGPRRRVLAVPPDYTRLHSRAGELTRYAYDYYGGALRDVMPALGTHAPMGAAEIAGMFPGLPPSLFRVHDWRGDIVELGRLPASAVEEASEGAVSFDWPAQVNRILVEGGHDLVLSIGQVLPHEIVGMANYTKNLLVGLGGAEAIDRSHYLGAVYGIERLLGRADNPVRRLLDRAWEEFAPSVQVVFVHTVLASGPGGEPEVRGLFVGDDREVFARAAELSARVNVTLLDEPIRKAIAYLEPALYRSAWVANKAIYRLRMAMAEGGELAVLAPGVSSFGEDPGIDAIIRKYGYRDRAGAIEAVARNADLARSLGAAAHLVHGCPEGRFTVVYSPGGLSRREVESVGFRYEPYEEAARRYGLGSLREGWGETREGERVFFAPRPAQGLWASRARFADPT
jgi:nickel-dependent lactate racemase